MKILLYNICRFFLEDFNWFCQSLDRKGDILRIRTLPKVAISEIRKEWTHGNTSQVLILILET